MKNEPDYIQIKQIISILVCILILYLLMYFQVNINIIIVSFSYLIIVLSSTLLPIIKQRYRYSNYLQRFLGVIPLFLIAKAPLNIVQSKYTLYTLKFFLLGIFCVLALHTIDYKKNIELLTGISSAIPIKKKHLVSELFLNILSAFGEEYWFRFIFIANFQYLIGPWTILLSTILFLHIHFIGRWSSVYYNYEYYLKIFIISIISSTLFYITNNLVYSFIIHLVFNITFYILLLKKCFFLKTVDDLFDDY